MIEIFFFKVYNVNNRLQRNVTKCRMVLNYKTIYMPPPLWRLIFETQ